MWPFGGAALVSLGLLPTAWQWLAHGQQQTTLWHTAASYAITDATFVLGSLIFLYVAIKYGDTRSKQRPAPYPGAWVEADGRQHAPRGFAPGYLGFALVWSLLIPAAVLLLSSGQACQPLVAATLGPYLLVFVPQIALETKYLNRSFMTPVLPLLFMYYRLWQFVRSLALVAAHTAAAASSQQQQHWLTSYLMSLLVFWVFDTGCTLLWLPWMYDWQLQDPRLLSQLAEARQQEAATTMLAAAAAAKTRQLRPAGADASGSGAATSQVAAAAAAAGTAGGDGAGGSSHGMTTCSKARTPGSSMAARSRAAASHSSAEIDSYGFGA
uniref:Uncharacterized protein n=1 Tax=Tetradesmus obliquus TaxID=3088 RepID=A0A383VBX7_TETOB|eukprot:jgi/Sobl393_1/16337/SZX62124.1